MCPGTLAIIGTVAKVGSGIFSGIASGNAANYQAQVASNNRTIAQQNAGYSAAASSVRTEEQGEKSAAQLGHVRTGLATNNIDVNSGSAADVQTSQRRIGALDTASVAGQGARQVYGYETQASNYQAQANLDRSEANNDYVGGILKGVGDTADSVSSLPDSFSWMGGNSPPAVSYSDNPSEGGSASGGSNFPEFF